MYRALKKDWKGKLKVQQVKNPKLYTSMKWILILLIILLALVILAFVVVFIVFPLVFMNSIGVQRFFVFWNIDVPKNPVFQNPKQYGFYGISNFYISSEKYINSSELISLGAYWVPNEKYKDSNETMDEILAKNEFPVVLYNHGVASTRILQVDYGYATLRKMFHVIAIDYRDFGDSTPAELTEEGVVLDVVHTYNLMKTKTQADIYIWGHSLGGGISTHAVKWLKKHQNEIPAGLIIESSFTCFQDEVYAFPLGKVFSWLPWFEWCVIDPLHRNGFIFNTSSNAEDADCPIMIFHAEDDNVIPFSLGEKNYHQIKSTRKPRQGEVFFYPFAASKRYQHIGCLQDPDAPSYILQFIETCTTWTRTYDSLHSNHSDSSMVFQNVK
ncbi:hypothetical protein WA026_015083 [Henosepilachna vigintioctopunctata]|uniref:AB hydrolase-1 domain-containing protein n=1 Tax=Henosepilachna vigintioctopunctata TaxID=420089 RepID=A0AAW1U2R5_9CUCU